MSARMTNAKAVQKLDELLTKGINGEISRSQFVWMMQAELKQLGYDPATGFPQDMADVPPAAKGSIQDIGSEGRLRLIWDTNLQTTFNFGRVQAGNGDYERYWYPAWELARLYSRRVPRGSPESRTEGWNRRWSDAGESVGWEGALEGRMVALKDSPIWQALGDGEGGYNDTLGFPFPPFAFNSGMGLRPIGREECVSIGLIWENDAPEALECSLAPGDGEIMDNIARLSERLRGHALLTATRESSRVAKDFATIASRRAAHEAFVKSLTEGMV